MSRALPMVAAGLFLGTCSQPPSLIEQIRSFGQLRVVTRNSPTAYYLGPDGPMGPEYELTSRFAAALGVNLFMYPMDSFADILPEVASRRAHMAAAGLTVTPRRRELVRFGPAYQRVQQYLVYRLGTGRPRGIEDIIGTHIEVMAGTSHVDTLNALRIEHPELAWVENPNVEAEELLQRVSQRDIEYTVADSTEFSLSRYFHPEIRIAFPLKEADAFAWAFEKSYDLTLLRHAQQFFAALEETGELEQIMERYYGHAGRFDYVGTRSFLRHIDERLPRYREWFEAAGAATGIDWRLLAAIGYQESHWNPKAVSPTGVRGIMMLTRATAGYLDVENRLDPEQSIRGGARYFARMHNKIPERIPEPDRTWLALAAYNIGWGHLEDARILTEMHDKDPDRWAGVREHLPLLARKKWYTRVKRGYARGWEPVLYVENIRSYYDILVWVDPGREAESEAVETAETGPPAGAKGAGTALAARAEEIL